MKNLIETINRVTPEKLATFIKLCNVDHPDSSLILAEALREGITHEDMLSANPIIPMTQNIDRATALMFPAGEVNTDCMLSAMMLLLPKEAANIESLLQFISKVDLAATYDVTGYILATILSAIQFSCDTKNQSIVAGLHSELPAFLATYREVEQEQEKNQAKNNRIIDVCLGISEDLEKIKLLNQIQSACKEYQNTLTQFGVSQPRPSDEALRRAKHNYAIIENMRLSVSSGKDVNQRLADFSKLVTQDKCLEKVGNPIVDAATMTFTQKIKQFFHKVTWWLSGRKKEEEKVISKLGYFSKILPVQKGSVEYRPTLRSRSNSSV